ncbi:hypothetical protein JVX90_18680 [Gordonia sp. PDNC005]|uniref:hypothetical protein n=1 Tax=unclassified Gordonia (in: high G+C Gram-positive bacteria) TaxID=2657482 RepID=UPI001962D108|nr:hypothetical protein [Gordonia sp. PDNC005]QRY62372.1 hypothetical protein JVX90_18680 [Gordonia sp. PDNC005]
MSERLITIGGIGLAATGVAHFVAPSLFHGITAPAFPDDTAKAIQVNGTAETLIGVAIAVPMTRKAGFVGLGLYGAYLAANAAKARGSR